MVVTSPDDLVHAVARDRRMNAYRVRRQGDGWIELEVVAQRSRMPVLLVLAWPQVWQHQRSCSTSRGKRKRAMRRAIASPSACHPSYLNAWTIDSTVPPGSANAERAARTNAGSSGHHAHGAEGRATLIGCPQRSQRGRGSSCARSQHAPQTSSRS